MFLNLQAQSTKSTESKFYSPFYHFLFFSFQGDNGERRTYQINNECMNEQLPSLFYPKAAELAMFYSLVRKI